MINVEDKWWQLMGNDGEWLVVGAWNHINFGDVTQNVGYSTSWPTTIGVCNGANIRILAIPVGQIKAKKKDAWHCRLCWNQGPKPQPKEFTEPKLKEEVLVEGYTSTASKLFSLISHRHLGLFCGPCWGGEFMGIGEIGWCPDFIQFDRPLGSFWNQVCYFIWGSMS